MTTRRAKQLVLSTLTAGFVTYATVPGATKWEVTEILVQNGDSGAAHDLRMRYGGIELVRLSIAALAYQRLVFFTVLKAGDTIEALGATNTHLLVSGIEVTPV